MKINLRFCLTLLTLTASQTLAQPIYTPYTFTTLAGSAGRLGSTDGIGNTARFAYPSGMAVDTNGNVYVADAANHTIRKMSPAGQVTTLAGWAGGIGSADGTGIAAQFFGPSGVAVDNAGNVYVADRGNHTIRKVTPVGTNWVVTTLAGLAGYYWSTDGTGPTARFRDPSGVAVDDAGNVYVADSGNNTIRKVTSAGVVTTLAGVAEAYGSADGTGPAARFGYPSGVAVDSAGNVYVADSGNHTIRKVTGAGVVTTLAGLAGSAGSADGTGSTARFYLPWGVEVDVIGNVYVADNYNHSIRKVTPTGEVTTLAGLARYPSSADGTGGGVWFNYPQSVAVDSAGNLYVADSYNHTIRRGFGAETVQFGRSYFGAGEDAGFGSITVTLGRSYPNEVSVDFATSDGTARAGEDYGATNGTLTFLPGAMIATTQVPICNDSLVEGLETVNLTLRNPTGGVRIGVPTNVALTITNNDFFTFASPSDINENEGAVAVQVRRFGETDTPLSVAYFTRDGFQLDNYYSPVPRPAMAGVDYRAMGGILTLEVGETNKTFTIPILDNGRLDGDRAFLVNLINPFDTSSQSPILIHDNERLAGLDLGFDPGSGLSSQYFGYGLVNALVVQPDGKILIGGGFETVADVGRTNIARLNADGSLDPSFAAGTSLTDLLGGAAQVSVVALQTNGQIVIAGNFTNVNGVNLNGLARLNSNGSLDSNFNSFAGIALTNQVIDLNGNPVLASLKALATQEDGKVIIGGTFDAVNGVGRTNLARLNPNGSLDTNFVGQTELTHDFFLPGDPFFPVPTVSSISALALQSDGTILVGGTFTTVNGADRTSIVRLNPNGSLDNRFFVGDGVEDGENPGTINSITVQPDGRLYLAGQFTSVHGVGRNNLARLNGWDGSLDSSFSSSGNQPVDAIATEDDLVVLVAEASGSWNSEFTLKRLNSDGSLDEGFPTVQGGGRITAMATQPDGNVLIGGSFSYININNGDPSFERPGLARIYGNPTWPRAQFAPNLDPNTGYYSTTLTVSENSAVATMTVERLGESWNALTVDYATLAGTARAGVNYVATNGTVTFAPLEVSRTINIPILDDHLVQNDLVFRVSLTHPIGGVLGVSDATVFIQNSDLGFPPGGITRQADGQVNLMMYAPQSGSYILQGSTNLVNWVSLSTNTGSGYLYFTDTNAPRFNHRFYRLRWP